MVDTEGLILKTFVTAANLNDREGLYGILDTRQENDFTNLRLIWADAGYQGEYAHDYVMEHGIGNCSYNIILILDNINIMCYNSLY